MIHKWLSKNVGLLSTLALHWVPSESTWPPKWCWVVV